MISNLDLNKIIHLADSIYTIQKYKQYVKPSEKLIDNVEKLYRLIIRRHLKRYFNKFSIRKNTYDYALRCEDKQLYRIMYLAYALYNNSSFLSILDEDIKKKISPSFDQATNIIARLHEINGITYSFKDNERFFIYVNFGHQYPMGYNQSNFYQYCTVRRLEAIEQLSTLFSDIKFDPIVDDIIYLVDQASIYSVYDIFTEKQLLITEGYLKLFREIGHTFPYYKRVEDTLEAYLAKQNELNEVSGEKAKVVFENDREEEIPVPRGFRLVETADDSEENEENINNDENDQDAIALQERFNSILRRIREERQSANNEISATIVSINPATENHRAIYDPINGDLITLQNALLLLNSNVINFDTPENLQITSLDIYDDNEENDKNGLYFTIEDNEVVYYIYDNNKSLFTTKNLQNAVKFYQDKFHETPKEVKFFRVKETKEEIDNIIKENEETYPF